MAIRWRETAPHTGSRRGWHQPVKLWQMEKRCAGIESAVTK